MKIILPIRFCGIVKLPKNLIRKIVQRHIDLISAPVICFEVSSGDSLKS